MKKNILIALFGLFIIIACKKEKEIVPVSQNPCTPQYPFVHGGVMKGTFAGVMQNNNMPFQYDFDLQYEDITPSVISEISDGGTYVRIQRSNVCGDLSRIQFRLKAPLSSYSFPLLIDTSNSSYYYIGVWLTRNIGDSIVHTPYYQRNQSDSTIQLVITSYDSVANKMIGTFMSDSVIRNGMFDVRFKKVLERKK